MIKSSLPQSLYLASLLPVYYCAAQMMSDIASLRIVTIFGMPIDAGTLIYPITFTLRDLLHRHIGARATLAVIVGTASTNLIMAGLFNLVSILPPDMGVGPQTEFGAVLSMTMRIVFASICAEVISESADTAAYSAWAARFGESQLWGRVAVSNLVATPIDSILFTWLAFGDLQSFSSIVIAQMLLKWLVGLVSVPLIYLFRDSGSIRRE